MPPKTKIYKEDILNIAYDIAKIHGMEAVNARAIAESLKCSVQPIFHKFGNMENLKQELIGKMIETYRSYMTKDLDCDKLYKQLGRNYIRFAKEEPVIFKTICMGESELNPQSYLEKDQETMANVVKYASEITKLDGEAVKRFHIKIWIFTHGIATLVASNTCRMTDDEIDMLLQEEYMALMTMEQDKNNK